MSAIKKLYFFEADLLIVSQRMVTKRVTETGDTGKIIVEGFDEISRRVGSVDSGFVNFGGGSGGGASSQRQRRRERGGGEWIRHLLLLPSGDDGIEEGWRLAHAAAVLERGKSSIDGPWEVDPPPPGLGSGAGMRAAGAVALSVNSRLSGTGERAGADPAPPPPSPPAAAAKRRDGGIKVASAGGGVYL
uniref:Uncharacterized protein n=1 Tax=Oryza sativa subsp. japonica TaxID=39947 RepID=Q6ETC6_ORYSJ|nr:hypothetical protein [Oryza sativa Japonica Group]